jgi:hypothetical protein
MPSELRWRAPSLWMRALLFGIALLLAAIAFAATQPPRLSGYLGNEVVLQGHLEPGANVSHPLTIVIPGAQEQRGLRFEPGPAAVNFRPGGALDAPPFRVAVVGQGRVFIDVLLDPSNPLNAPQGPPVTYLPSGAYELRVHNPGNASMDYEVHEAIALPYAATQQGAFVANWWLLVVAVLAAAGALAPPWRRPPARADAPQET